MQIFVKPLLQQGFHVVAFDVPAHGASSGMQTTLLKSAESLRRVASEVAAPFAIVGHSFGAVVGAVAASVREDHAALREIKQLVLISPPDRMTDMLSRYQAELHIAPAALAYIKERIEKVAGRPVETLSTRAFVAASKLPAMVIHDKNDKEVPVTEGSAIAEGSPSTRFVETVGLGHRRILLSAFVADAVADFLKGENENAASEEFLEEVETHQISSSD
jgi:pimeloyl-ACP methyl ester carboxylesterase